MKLLLCPFCWHKPYKDADTALAMGSRIGHNYAIACSYCEASGPGTDTYTDAMIAWNTRTNKNRKYNV